MFTLFDANVGTTVLELWVEGVVVETADHLLGLGGGWVGERGWDGEFDGLDDMRWDGSGHGGAVLEVGGVRER